MSQLRTYHSLIRSVRHEENVYATDLICDEQGRPRWRDFASGIEAIDRLRALIKIPDRLKQVLTTEGMIDRGALDVATQNLENRLKDLEGRVNSLSHRLTVGGVETGKAGYADVSPVAFQDWLQNMETAVRQRVAKLQVLAAMLEANQDVALSDLPTCVAQLEEICGLQSKQNKLCSELNGVIDQALSITQRPSRRLSRRPTMSFDSLIHTATHRVPPCSMSLHKAGHDYLSQTHVRGWHPSTMMRSSERGRLFGNAFRQIILPFLVVALTGCLSAVSGHGLTSKSGR